MADISIDDARKLSQLERTQHLSKDDLIVIEQEDASYKLTYAQLLSIVAGKMKPQFGTAAFCEASQFAKFAHGHDYSDFDFFSSYDPRSEDVEKIGDFKIMKYTPGEDRHISSTVTMYQSLAFDYDIDDEAKKYINSVKSAGDILLLSFNNPTCTFKDYLMACRNVSAFTSTNIDISDTNFDGYVLPNGDTFTCGADEFKDACKAFAGDPYATSFTVPDLHQQFVKLSDKPSDVTFQPVEGHTAMPSHRHALTPIYTDGKTIVNLGRMTLQTSMPPDAGVPSLKKDSRYAHFICKENQKKDVPVAVTNIQLDGQITKVEVLPSKSTALDSYPTNDSVFALMYIGQR